MAFYQRLKSVGNVSDVLTKIKAGDIPALGGASQYTMHADFFAKLSEHTAFEAELVSINSVSGGLWVPDDGDALTLVNFNVTMRVGTIESPASINFETLFQFAKNGGKTAIVGRPANTTYKKGAYAGKTVQRCESATPLTFDRTEVPAMVASIETVLADKIKEPVGA